MGGSDVTSCSVEEVLGGEDSVVGGSQGGASSHTSRKYRMSSPGLSWLKKSGAFVLGGDRIKDGGGVGVWEGEEGDSLGGGLARLEEDVSLGESLQEVKAGW